MRQSLYLYYIRSPPQTKSHASGPTYLLLQQQICSSQGKMWLTRQYKAVRRSVSGLVCFHPKIWHPFHLLWQCDCCLPELRWMLPILEWITLLLWNSPSNPTHYIGRTIVCTMHGHQRSQNDHDITLTFLEDHEKYTERSWDKTMLMWTECNTPSSMKLKLATIIFESNADTHQYWLTTVAKGCELMMLLRWKHYLTPGLSMYELSRSWSFWRKAADRIRSGATGRTCGFASGFSKSYKRINFSWPVCSSTAVSWELGQRATATTNSNTALPDLKKRPQCRSELYHGMCRMRGNLHAELCASPSSLGQERRVVRKGGGSAYQQWGGGLFVGQKWQFWQCGCVGNYKFRPLWGHSILWQRSQRMQLQQPGQSDLRHTTRQPPAYHP